MNLEEYELEPVEVTPAMERSWKQITPWTLFLAIVGFINTLLLLILMIVYIVWVISMLNRPSVLHFDGPSPGLLFLFGLLALTGLGICCFFSNYWLTLFSAQIRRSLNKVSQDQFERAWRNLKMHFRIVGIQLIILLFTIVMFYIAFGPNLARRIFDEY
jgi:hypothetical protein